MTKVVDTSVVVKWFVREEGGEAAKALIGMPLIAPELLVAEVSNVAWTKWRREEIGVEQALWAQKVVTSFVELVPFTALAQRALEIAIELKHPAYDCFYLALCETQQLPFVTADKRLITRCDGTRFAFLLETL